MLALAGFWSGSEKDLADCVRPVKLSCESAIPKPDPLVLQVFDLLIPAVLKEGIKIAIVTFSPQMELIAKAAHKPLVLLALP